MKNVQKEIILMLLYLKLHITMTIQFMLRSMTYEDTGSQDTSENGLKQQQEEFSFFLLV